MRKLRPSKQRQALIEQHRAHVTSRNLDVPGSTPAPLQLFGNRISLSITEFAAQTGLSPKTVERMIKRREIRALRTGRRVLIPMSAVEAWLNQKD